MKQAIKKSLCIVLTALMLLTAVPLSGFVGMEFGISAQAASETGRVELVTDWTVNPANNTIAVYVNFVDAVDLKSWDLVINYDPAIFAYKAYLNGKDAKQVNNSTSNGYTMEFNDAWDADSFKFSGYFREVLWSAEEFYADSDFSEGFECIVDSDNFQALVIYLTVVDAEKFAAENTAITITEADSSMTFVAAKAVSTKVVSAKVESGVSDIPSTTYHDVTATLNDDYFSKDSKVYNHDLGRFCSLFTVIGYNDKSTIKKHLENCGFTVNENYIVTDAGRDEVNNFITHKEILIDGKNYTLIFAGLIGSHEQQWYSNFDPGTGSTHIGFLNAQNYVMGKLEKYIKKLDIDKSNTKILLTGHSRGAATCNLVAAQLIASELYATKEDIYAYAFATPRMTSADYAKNTKYNRIFNIVNPEDFVTKLLPGAWGFRRFGTTPVYESEAINVFTLPSKTNTKADIYKDYLAKMQSYYKILKPDAPYEPYKDGEKTVHDVVYAFRHEVDDLDEYYNQYIWPSGTPYVFFQNALCPIVAHDYLKFATVSLTHILLILRTTGKNNVYRKMIEFFLSSEAIYKITSGLDFTEEDLLTFSNPYFSGSHLAETYCAYMFALNETELRTKRTGYRLSVNCPVDVEIYDKENGEPVGRIVNNVVDEEIAAKENSVVMTVDGDSKQFWLPSDGDYEIRLIGNDTGTMDYTLSEIDSDIGEVKRVNFFDVEIKDGLTMTAELESESFVIEDHELIFDDGSAMEPTEILNEEEIPVYSIEITTENGGSASNSRTAKSGDYVSLSATADEGWQFVGWFENDELLTNEPEFAFVAKSDRKLSAMFEHIDHDFSDWSEVSPADCENAGSEQRVCEICDAVEAQEIAALGHSEEVIPGKAATCTATGLTDGKKCTVCGEVTVAQTEIAKLAHSKVTVNQKAATATENGYTGDVVCSVCSTEISKGKVIPATGVQNNNCDHICHKDGFIGFIWKIVQFFWKLFGMNPVCECGKAHY